jgi:hypothetical protein
MMKYDLEVVRSSSKITFEGVFSGFVTVGSTLDELVLLDLSKDARFSKYSVQKIG